jgi:hypothetical protein
MFRGDVGERRERLDRELEQRPVRGAATVHAPGARVLDRDLVETDPGDHSAQEPSSLGHLLECVDHAARHEPEVARLALIRDLREAMHHRVEARRQRDLEPALVAADPPRIDHIGALARTRDHVRDQLRRILEVRVHEHRVLAPHVVDTG